MNNLVLRANGIIEKIDYTGKYEELSELVGGYIETLYFDKGILMILNEEGKINNLDFNYNATMIYNHMYNYTYCTKGDYIVGDVILLNSDESNEALTKEQEDYIKAILSEDIKVCSICKKEFRGFGNSPRPLAEEGVCCDECNNKVIESRLEKMGITQCPYCTKETTKEEIGLYGMCSDCFDNGVE